MKTCIECGGIREINRRYCPACYRSRKAKQSREYYRKFGRHYYDKTCEACKTLFKSCSKSKRLCPLCREASLKYSTNATNPYENAGGAGYIWKHRRIAEELMARTLLTNEVIHHVNENPRDNSVDNLWIMTRQDHGRLHSLLRTERVIFEKSKNENPMNCWETLRASLTTTWLETTGVKVIKLVEIGQSAAEPLSSDI